MRRGGSRHTLRDRAGEAGRTLLVVLVSVALLLAAAGFAAYDAGWLDRWRGPDRPRSAAPAAPALPPPPGLELPDLAPPRPVLAAAATRSAGGAGGAGGAARAGGALPSRRALAAQLAGPLRDDDLGRHVGVLVEPLGRSAQLLRVGGDDLFTPASTLKLLTSTAALELLGPGHRFTTTVVGRPARNRPAGNRAARLVLVGGGDPLLARRPAGPSVYPAPATIADLARQTAAKLADAGVRRVRLGYDASLFSGPAVNPRWEPGYVPDGVVSPITALWVDEGRVAAGLAARVDDPALAAAQAFAAVLSERGVTVAGRPRPRVAPAGAPSVARVRSAPLAQIVQHLLELSDNEASEVLLRHLGLASGRAGTSEAGAAALTRTLTELGVDLGRARIYDGSGLSRDNRLTLDALVETMQVAASPDRPDLRRVLSGLPVAGFNGSLAYRFEGDAADGRGLVRAKTGTLSGVHALAGVAVDHDGTALVFVGVADRVRLVDTLDARATLDELAAGIAGCCD